ncbi:tetratricopeptide repeat protein [Comamonas faecalis]|uniref:Tetratricopeptide repeat protein n=1 Tax=Comamonas faecalis TaxID=1387849 RepID=A0ABP7QHD6_9BURK
MAMHFDVPTPLQYFASLVQEEPIALLEAAACIGHDEDPRLDVQQVLDQVDAWLARLQRRIPADAAALQRLGLLQQFFFRELGFAGNLNDYYAPENSYLHAVVRTRRGIPISLAVLWLELAQAIGLKAFGVSFPGHFLVKVRLTQGWAVIDPMTGESLSREAVSERLQLVLPADAPVHDDALIEANLRAAPPRETLARMLHNLKEIHHAAQDWQRLLAVHDRLLVLLPRDWPEWRDRGLTRMQLGQMQEAAQDLQTYLDHARQAEDAQAITMLVQALRSGGAM